MEAHVQKGNRFRDLVSQIFAAAGFDPSSEVQAGAKKTDLRSVWIRHEFEGPIRYLIEAKDYDAALPLTECSKFVAEYGTAIENDQADKAYLISKGPITPAGRALVDNNRRKNLYCFTFEEFQRNIMRIDAVMANQIRKYDQDGIENYYIPPKTKAGEDLEGLVRNWLHSDDGKPTAVIGAYGAGKSTFATHLAAKLAQDALVDATQRVPIVVTLGDIVDEQSIEGLISKTLASQHRVANYHFHLFSKLNECGRFVIIFDGFDEMKHGMTPTVFERNFHEILKLDKGLARLLLLGRDTIFHSDREFQMIIAGRRATPAGTEVPIQGRRACTPIFIDGFSLDDAKTFVKRYYPFKVKQDQKFDVVMRERLDLLLSGAFDDLLIRPVHAQMLCEIATDPHVDLQKINKFELYDRFVSYLLDREARKRGRSSAFSLETRRKVNVLVAWWLWEGGGVSTTSLESIPIRLLSNIVKGVIHEFDEVGLRRELLIGCLVEKSDGVIYFPHRSIQEFLVSEYLYENSIEGDATISNQINSEIVDFLIERFERDQQSYEHSNRWLDKLAAHQMSSLPQYLMPLLKRLGACRDMSLREARSSQWHFWSFVLSASGGNREIGYSDALWERATSLCMQEREKNLQYDASCILALLYAFSLKNNLEAMAAATLVSILGDFSALSALIDETKNSAEIEFVRAKNVRLWIVAACIKIHHTPNSVELQFDIGEFFQAMKDVLRDPFDGMIQTICNFNNGVVFCSADDVYSCLRHLGKYKLDRVRHFFSDEQLREKIRILQYQRYDDDDEDWQGVWIARVRR